MAESPVTTSMAPSHQLVTTYTARYDAAGNMTCRAPDTTTTCAGTPTGAKLSYDTQGAAGELEWWEHLQLPL